MTYKTATFFMYASTLVMASMPVLSAETVPSTPEPLTLTVQEKHDLEEILVSGTRSNKKLINTVSGATVLTKEKLARSLSDTLGETLSSTPGMSSTFFGPGASRPVIRGLGGSRILVLDNGLGAIDASSTSPDHAVSVEPALAQRIEVLRGTAMLMYGSSAAGGIVNVMDGRMPNSLIDGDLSGAVRLGYSHNTRGVDASASLSGTLWQKGDTGLVFYAGLTARDAGNYRIPGFAESSYLHDLELEEDHDEHLGHVDHDDDRGEEVFGLVDNSSSRSKSANLGLSYIGARGFIGVNAKVMKSNYGIPVGHSHSEEEEGVSLEEGVEDVRIDLDQSRLDVMGSLKIESGFVKSIDVRFGYADYKHQELEGPELGTLFTNKGFEGRVDIGEEYNDTLFGRSGFLYKERSFEAIGAEAFVPSVTSGQFGLYTLKEYESGPWMIDLGTRFEHTSYQALNVGVLEEQIDRSFSGVSFSGGLGYNISDENFAGVSLYRTKKAPSLEELFSYGAHLATQSFEVGSVDLQMETATGIELNYKYRTEELRAEVNLFHTHYSNFIYSSPLGRNLDELPIYAYRQRNVTLSGVELAGNFHLGEQLGFDLHLDAQMDYVRLRRAADVANKNLPMIPPLSALLALEGEREDWTWRLEADFSAKQTAITDEELPTDSYLLVNAYVTFRPFDMKTVSIDLKLKNLFDAEARQHTSVLKDLAPQPGRDIRLSLRYSF